MSFKIATVILLLGTLSSAMAVRSSDFPEVIPGPGMPSLASLGVTSEELYNMPLNVTGIETLWIEWASWLIATLAPDGEISVLYDNHCGPDNSFYARTIDVIALYNYLLFLPPNQQCVATDAGVTYGAAGTARILGISRQSGRTQSDKWYVFEESSAISVA